MGTIHKIVREFHPDPAAFDDIAQRVSVAYLTKLAVYGQCKTPRLRYQMAFETPDSHEASFTLEFDLNGNVLKTRFHVHMINVARAKAASSQVTRSILADSEHGSVGYHIALWQAALHELYHNPVLWEVWEYLILADDSPGWVQEIVHDYRSM